MSFGKRYYTTASAVYHVAENGYKWSVLPEREHLFTKQLSKRSVGAHKELCREVGKSFEAVTQPMKGIRLSDNDIKVDSSRLFEESGPTAHSSTSQSLDSPEATGFSLTISRLQDNVTRLRNGPSSEKERVRKRFLQLRQIERRDGVVRD